MGGTFFTVAKFLDDKKYLEEFRRGKLYMQRLTKFREIEEDANNYRADPCEAISGWFQPEQIVVTLQTEQGDKWEIPSCDLATPVQVQFDRYGYDNVLCLFAIHAYENKTFRDLEEAKRIMAPTDMAKRLGSYCCYVSNMKAFLDRIQTAAKLQRYRFRAQLVKYFDPETFHGIIPDDEAPFWKRNQFAHQREYRIVIFRQDEGTDPLIFDVGDLSDICHIARAEDFCNNLNVQFTGGLRT